MRHDDDLIHIDDIASVTIEKPFIQIRDQIMKTSIDNQFTARHSPKDESRSCADLSPYILRFAGEFDR